MGITWRRVSCFALALLAAVVAACNDDVVPAAPSPSEPPAEMCIHLDLCSHPPEHFDGPAGNEMCLVRIGALSEPWEYRKFRSDPHYCPGG